MNAMQVMDTTGHTTINWDPNSPEDVRGARETFNEMRAKGMQAFAIEGDNKRGRRMESFEPSAAKIMLIPQMAGG